MASPDSTIRLGQVGLEESIDKAIRKVNASGRLKLNINSNSFTQPLGRITAATDEFTKSIEASNARVIAFGASVGVINAISNAFKSLVKETVALEQRLTEVNVVLGANTDQLKSFGKELFNIARNTSQSFDAVSQAALEFSRQGLSVEETLKRTNDALILSRLTGLKAADSVKGLTATMNSFAQAGLSTAEVINKLAAVDVQFAVSSEDLINALSRAGSVAQDAGLNFDELIAAVTSAQQTTARGGAVIGNSFKTIFTRIQRSDTLDRLQELGIAVRNVQGETLPAMMILQQLAKSYDGLTDATKSAVAEQVGGVFQINILKAALRDLNNENSIYSRAVLTSAGATDQAIVKNEQLNKTLDSLSKQTITSVQELSAAIGEITVGPGIEKVLNAINDLSQGASKLLDGEGIGSTLANGVLKGLGTVISGPGLVLIGGLMLKLFVDTTKFATSSFKNLLGLNKKSQEQKALQDSILATLQSNRQISAVLAQLEGNKAAQSKFLLDQVQKTTTEYTKQVNLAKQLAANLGQAGVVGGAGGLSMRTGRRAAHGFIPNFSAEGREMMDIKKGVGGVSSSAKPVRLKNFNMGGGRIGDMVANSQEYYVKNFNGRGGDAVFNPDMVQKYGMPYGAKKINAANGYIPNFAKDPRIAFEEASSPAFLKGRTLKSAADAFNQIAEISIDPEKTIQASSSIDRARRYWGGAAFDRLVSPESQAKIRGEAKELREGKKDNPIRVIVNATGLQGYGAVTTENIKGGTKKFDFNDIVPSRVFKKVPQFGRDVRFDLKDLTVGSISNQTDPQLSQLIDEEVLDTISSISSKLIKSHKLTGKGNNDKIELSKVLDSSAGPQLKGRIFESVLDYMSLRLAKDQGDVPSKSANQLFDYPKGIPSQLNSVFSNPDDILDGLKIDAKSTMLSSGSSGPSSMVKKILEDKLKGDAKTKITQQVKALSGNQNSINLSSGYIPNFAGGVKVSDIPALSDSVMREKAAGIPSSAIRINTDKRLKNSGNPNGLAVTNIIDEPQGMRDVFASRGYVPNFAGNIISGLVGKVKSFTGANLGKELEQAEKEAEALKLEIRKQEGIIEKANKTLSSSTKTKEQITKEYKDIAAQIKKEKQTNGVNAVNQKKIQQLEQQQQGLLRERLRQGRAANEIQRATNQIRLRNQNLEDAVGRESTARRRVESKGAAMQNFGLQAIFIGPMIASAIEEAVFKGMDRAEMTRGQRQAQAALQGVGSGISSAGVVAQILTGFAKMNPYVRIAGIAFAGLAPVILKFMGAADLTTDELIAQNEKRKQAANDELAAAEKILNARKILADPANYSQNELDAASKTLRDNFTKIKDVQLQEAFRDAKGGINSMSKALKDFNAKIDLQNKASSLLISASSAKTNQPDTFNPLTQDLLSILNSFGVASKVFDVGSGQTVDGSVDQGFLNTIPDSSFGKTTILRNAIEKELSGETGFFPLNELKEDAIKSIQQSEAFKSLNPQGLTRRTKVQQDAIESVSKAFGRLEQLLNIAKKEYDSGSIRDGGITPDIKRSLAEQKNLAQKTFTQVLESLFTSTLGAQQIETDIEKSRDVASKIQEIKDSLQNFVANSVSDTARQIENIKFKTQINDKIRSFQESVLKSVLPSQDFIDFKSSGQISKIQKESQQKQTEFINKNIKKLSDDLATVFGTAGNIGVKAATDLTKLFAEDPAQALEEIVSFLEKGADGAEALKSRLKAAGLNAGENIDTLNRIDLNKSEGAKALRDAAKELLTLVNLEKDNLARRQAIVAVEKTIAEVQAKNALVVAKTQQNALLNNLALSKQIRENNFQLEKATTDIDFNINDPRQQLGGNAEIRRVARLEEDKVRLKFQTEDANRLIDIEKGISDIFKDQALINAMGLNTNAVDRNTDSNYKLAQAFFSSNKERILSRIRDVGSEIDSIYKERSLGVSPERRAILNDKEKTLIPELKKADADLVANQQAASEINKAKELALSQKKINITSPDLQKDILDIVQGKGDFSAAQNQKDKLTELDYILRTQGFSDKNIIKIQIETAKLIDLFEQGEISAKKLKESIGNIGRGVDVDIYKNTFQGGVDNFFKQIETETDSFGRYLGDTVPMAFRDGMVTAMDAAMDRSKDLGDSLRNMALGFLRTMQQAFLKNAANNLMQSFGFNSGGSVKGYAAGGQVGGKSVPAMLTNGEYVMGREAVQRMGVEKMAAINNGTYPIEGYSTGGEVGTKARDAYKTHMDRFGTSFTDNKSSRFYAELWRSSPKASDEVRLMGAAEDEARREREQKKAERREIFNTILSTIASVGINYGAQKFSDFMSQGSAEKFGVFARGSNGAKLQEGFGGSNFNNMTSELGYKSDLTSYGSSLMGKAPQLDLGNFKGFGKYSGGEVLGFASGGQVRGPAGRDVIPAVLTEGEYVIKASSARKYGKRFLDNINQGRKGFYNGGATSDMGSSGTNNFNVNMNFDISSDGGSSKEGSNEDSSKNKEKNEGFREFSNHIKQVVQSEIQKELRVGGMLRR